MTLAKTALFWFLLAIALICTIWACQGATIQQRGGRVLHQGIADDGELGIRLTVLSVPFRKGAARVA